MFPSAIGYVAVPADTATRRHMGLSPYALSRQTQCRGDLSRCVIYRRKHAEWAPRNFPPIGSDLPWASLKTTIWGKMSVFLFDKHSIAPAGYSRWLIPPAALCVHLCIGQAYAFSVFNLPMTKLLGITQSAPDDWKLTDLGWIFSLAIFFLGASAALLGRWVEEGGPRRAM